MLQSCENGESNIAAKDLAMPERDAHLYIVTPMPVLTDLVVIFGDHASADENHELSIPPTVVLAPITIVPCMHFFALFCSSGEAAVI